MTTRITASLAVLALAMSAGAAIDARSSTEPDISGTWTMTVEGHGGHGAMSGTLTLKQEGKNVTGKMAAHGSEHDVSGELVDGTLTLTVASESQDHQMSLTAKLKDDGTLAGYLSGPMGDVRWTAVRAQDKW